MDFHSTTLQSLVDQIVEARNARRCLRIRGGGSKDFYGNALGNFAVLDTRVHSGITSYEPSELVVTAKAGTPLMELEAALLEKNQYLPFEPPNFTPESTVGGMVAAGLNGAARASSGSVRDHVLGVQMVSSAADILSFGGTVMKNVAGYDVSRLLAGSMGTLGLISEVSLKVLPLPVMDRTIGFDVDQAKAITLMNRWRALPLPINSTAWVDARGTKLGRDALFVRLRGAVAAVESAVSQMTKSHSGYQLPAEHSPSVWRSANDHALPFFVPPTPDLCLWRLSLPATTPPLKVNHPQNIEWQGAQRWLWAPASEALALREIATQAGGHATLFRASVTHSDADKSAGVFQSLSLVLSRLNQNLRQQLDPHGVFNTGRMG